MSLDHGLLNLPLQKRMGKNIDALIDHAVAQQKASMAAWHKAVSDKRAADRIAAKALLEAMPAEQLARVAAKGRMTVAQARKQLASLAYFEPTKVLALKVSQTPEPFLSASAS